MLQLALVLSRSHFPPSQWGKASGWFPWGVLSRLAASPRHPRYIHRPPRCSSAGTALKGHQSFCASLVAQLVKNMPAVPETGVRSLGQEDPLEKGMAAHSSVLFWEIPWTEELGRLQSMGSQKSDVAKPPPKMPRPHLEPIKSHPLGMRLWLCFEAFYLFKSFLGNWNVDPRLRNRVLTPENSLRGQKKKENILSG